MFRNSGLLLLLLMFVNLSCGYNSNITGEKNYTQPVQLNHPRLMYPKLAQINSYTGNAKILFDINKDGKVSNVRVAQSSGSKILDNSAIEYCNNLIFEPAKVNGNPVKVRMSKVVKFLISKMDMLANNYINEINRLYLVLKNCDVRERLNIERKILHAHIDFVREMRDALNFNTYAALVISKNITEKWDENWDSWPLSFLIYYDFVQRYPDYDSLQYVKQLMFKAAKFDIDYIKNSSDSGTKPGLQAESLISKIKRFMKIHNPDFELNKIQSNRKNDEKRLSFNNEN
jgi:TonB family protein